MVNIESQRFGICQTLCYLIWRPKYRRDILSGTVAQTVKILLETVYDKNRWTPISKVIQSDPVDIFVSLPPVQAIAQAVRIFEGTTAYPIFKKFQKRLKSLSGAGIGSFRLILWGLRAMSELRLLGKASMWAKGVN